MSKLFMLHLYCTPYSQALCSPHLSDTTIVTPLTTLVSRMLSQLLLKFLNEVNRGRVLVVENR